MAAQQFITIGSKGVSIPTELTLLEPPLQIGVNNLRWANPNRVEAARKAHGWVSENGEPFEIYPLQQALRERRIQLIEGAVWTVEGRRYKGNAYLPSSWRNGEKFPQYVAVTAPDWPHGRVESRIVRRGQNRHVVGKLELPKQAGSPITRSLSTTKPPPRKWTREELLVLLNVYDKLPFGQFDEDQPVVQSIAKQMDRTGGSVAMKLGNLASLDPAIRARGRKGLPGASNLDREVWNEFAAHRSDLAPQSEELFRKLFGAGPDDDVELIKKSGVCVRKLLTPPNGSTESSAQRKVRRGQDYFRQVVLNAYDACCCITGIEIPELLVASHIKPWRACNDEERLNARNGLCLSKLQDAAFDSHLITLDERLCVVLGRRLRSFFPQPALEQSFVPFAGKVIRLPNKLTEPDPMFLAYHRSVFSKVNR